MKDIRRYEVNLKQSLDYVDQAKRDGIRLSRAEEFDYMFKTRLRDGFVPNVVKYMFNRDYRLACFYARFFKKFLERDYYNKSEIKWFFEKAYNYAIGVKADLTNRLEVYVWEYEGYIKLYIYEDDCLLMEYDIVDEESLVEAVLYGIAHIGLNKYDRGDEFFDFAFEYLQNVYIEVDNGIKPTPLKKAMYALEGYNPV